MSNLCNSSKVTSGKAEALKPLPQKASDHSKSGGKLLSVQQVPFTTNNLFSQAQLSEDLADAPPAVVQTKNKRNLPFNAFSEMRSTSKGEAPVRHQPNNFISHQPNAGGPLYSGLPTFKQMAEQQAALRYPHSTAPRRNTISKASPVIGLFGGKLIR